MLNHLQNIWLFPLAITQGESVIQSYSAASAELKSVLTGEDEQSKNWNSPHDILHLHFIILLSLACRVASRSRAILNTTNNSLLPSPRSPQSPQDTAPWWHVRTTELCVPVRTNYCPYNALCRTVLYCFMLCCKACLTLTVFHTSPF